MPRYGSQSEGFDQTLAQFAARERQRTEIIAKEAEKRKTGAAEEERVQAERTAARQEAVNVAKREESVAGVQARNTKLDTAAIEQNTAARRANVAAREQQAAAQGRFQSRATSTGKSYFVEDTATGQRASGLFRAAAGGEERARTAATFANAGAQVPASASKAAQAALTAEAVASQRAAEATTQRAVAEREAGSSSKALAIRQDALRPGAAQYAGGPTTGRYSPYAPVGRTQFVGPRDAPTRQQGAAEVREQSRASQEAAAAEAQRVKLARESNSIYAQTAGQNALVARTTREVTAEYGLASNALRRHGALTAEFIAQGAKGEVTMRELGYQTLTTIGKFAGWTAAAGLVYGAFKAITDFGAGAIESQNTVQNLQRFINTLDTDKARVQLRQLALGVNVPFKEAGEAVSGFARIFKNQDDAFRAARVGLTLTKLDAISAADAYRSLVAVSQGFHFGQNSKPLQTIGDQIAAYQREYGAKASEVTQGFSKAAGPFAVGGGTPSVLGALLATGVQGGLTGSVVATALGRSATTFRYKPENQKILRAYGVDPTADYDSVINQVMGAITKRHLGKEDIRQLSIGLGGPQLGARTFTVLLNNAAKYQEILQNTTPEKVKGKAQEELNTKLGQFSEITKSVSVGLQAMGSSLEQSGALIPLQGLLVGLREVFRLTQSLTGSFAELGPVAKIALSAVAVGGAASLLRGSATLARIPILNRFASQDSVDRLGIKRGLEEQKKAVADVRAGAAASAVRTQIQAEGAQSRLSQYQLLGANARALPPGHPGREAYDRRVAVLSAEAKAAQERGNIALAELASAKKIALRTEQEIADIDKTRAESTVFGIPTRARPSTVPLNKYGPGISGGEAVTEGGVVVPGGAVSRGEREAEKAKAEAQRAKLSLGSFGEKVASGLGFMGPTIVGGVEKAGEGIKEGAKKLEGAPAAIKGATIKTREGLNKLSSTFGLLDGLFAAFIGLELLGAAADAIDKKGSDAIAVLSKRPTSAAQQAAQANYQGGLEDPSGQSGINRRGLHFGGLVPSTKRFVSNLNDIFSLRAPTTYDDKLAEQQALKEGASELKYNDAIHQAQERRKGKPLTDLFPEQLNKGIDDDARAFEHGQISFRELAKRMAKHGVELKTSQYLTNAQVREARDKVAGVLAAASDKTPDYLKAISAMSQKAIDAEIKRLTGQLTVFGSSSAQGQTAIRHMQTIATYTGGQALRSGNYDRFEQIEKGTTEAIQQQAQADLKINLALATTQSQRDAAYREAETTIGGSTKNYKDQVDQAKTNLAHAQAREKAAKAAAKRYGAEVAHLTPTDKALGSLLGDSKPEDQLAQAKAREAQAAADIKKRGADSKKAWAAYREAQRAKAAAALAVEHDQATEQVDAGNIGAQIATARLGPYADPVQAARNAAGAAASAYQTILAHKRAFKPSELAQAYLQMLTTQNDVVKAINDQAKAISDAKFDLQIAKDEGDPIKQARDAQAKANHDLALAHTEPERLAALKAQVDANNQLQKAIQDREQARFTYLESLTTDPLKIDRYKIQADQKAVSAAKRGTKDWYLAMAQLNGDKQKLADDVLTGKEDDIQFDLDMDKITKQDAIARYQALLKSKNLTKAQQRDLQRKIADLNKQITSDAGGFDVNLGSIKLPTSLDVRRAIKGATDFRDSAISARQFQTNATINIYAQGGPGSAADVADGIDRVLTTSVRASMRTAGIR